MFVTDIYGSSSVVGVQPPSPLRWRPSQVGEDVDRKRNAGGLLTPLVPALHILTL